MVGGMEFTPRERDILRLVGREKMTAPQAAERLDLSRRTIHTYVYELSQRLPGDGKPRYRIMRFVDRLDADDREDL